MTPKKMIQNFATTLATSRGGDPPAVWRACAELMEGGLNLTAADRLDLMRVAHCALSLQVAILHQALTELGVEDDWTAENKIAVDDALEEVRQGGN